MGKIKLLLLIIFKFKISVNMIGTNNMFIGTNHLSFPWTFDRMEREIIGEKGVLWERKRLI